VASKLAERLEQNIDVLLLVQDVRQFHYAGDQFPRKDNPREQGEPAFHDFQPLSSLTECEWG